MEKEQIIKALACCFLNYACDVCPITEELDCRRQLDRNILSLIKELTEENEKLKSIDISKDIVMDSLAEENAKLKQHNDSYAEIEQGYIVTGVKKVQADTVREMQVRFAMHFGTYRPTDEVKVTEVFNLLKKISGEMLYEEEEE